MKITSREIIIAAIAILVLLGIGYLINKNQSSNKNETKKEDVNLNGSSTSSAEKSEDKNAEYNNDSNITSITPEPNSTVSTKPNQVSITFKKAVKGGSEIKVATAKGVDVVPGANIVSKDGKTLIVPVAVADAGAYKVAYSYCLEDGTCKNGTYSFTVK
ncbi:MAG TPA: copper resistance protein CopC [Candidatus Saccharimonadales bacterium]|nr:copper resistance protein CopC [Candidatus Saccharimonadales bacterium]